MVNEFLQKGGRRKQIVLKKLKQPQLDIDCQNGATNVGTAEAANETDLTALIEKKDANGRDDFLKKMQRTNSKEKIEIITTQYTSPIIKKESLAKMINLRLT